MWVVVEFSVTVTEKVSWSLSVIEIFTVLLLQIYVELISDY